MRATSSMEDVRVFDNFSIYPQQYWGEGVRGRMDWNPRLDPFSKLRSRSRGREREREKRWNGRKGGGGGGRKRNKSTSTSSTYFLYR